MAVLNDLGVVAEHFLVALNGQGQLTYAENIQNDFVSLQNPLYPNGPRLNFSINFEAVTKDQALWEVGFRFLCQMYLSLHCLDINKYCWLCLFPAQ